MGVIYTFGSPEKEERIELDNLGHLNEDSEFDRLLITNYIKMNGCRRDITVSFIGDEMDKRFDDVFEWRDATTDVLTFMFENGWVPETKHFDFIFRKFKEADKINRLTKWMKRWWD